MGANDENIHAFIPGKHAKDVCTFENDRWMRQLNEGTREEARRIRETATWKHASVGTEGASSAEEKMRCVAFSFCFYLLRTSQMSVLTHVDCKGPL